MAVQTCYANKDTGSGFYKVRFCVLSTGVELTKSFDSEDLARKFVNRLKHSKRCELISHPVFRW